MDHAFPRDHAFLVGVALLANRTWTAYVGNVLLNAIGQLLNLAAFPVWSIIVIAIDVMIIYGLTLGTMRTDPMGH